MISGSNLPSSMVGNIQGSTGHCIKVSASPNHVVMNCVAQVAGQKRFYLKTVAGATASDNVDGNITNKITKISTVNTSVIGTFDKVTYNVKDAAGKATFNGALASRTCPATTPPPSPSGLKGVLLRCSTTIAKNALTGSTIVATLPLTVNVNILSGTTLSIPLATNSTVYDGANTPLQTTLTNGSVTVSNNRVSYSRRAGT